jgi:Fe-S cluster assembly protein SufD
VNAITHRPATGAEEELAHQLEGAGAERAAAGFVRTGLPTRRQEAYHYTDLKSLLRDVPPLAAAVPVQAGITIAGALRFAVNNGIPQLAGPVAGVGAQIGKGPVGEANDDVVLALNQGLVRSHLRLELSGNTDRIVHVDHVRGGPAAHVNSALSIEVAAGASVTVVETFSGSAMAHLGNHFTAVKVGDGARFTHIVLDKSHATARHLASIHYEIGADVQFRSLVINGGAALSRTSISANFGGSGTHGDFGGLNLAGDGTHLDISLDIVHAVAGTTSTELFKQVANRGGKAVFQGKIIVARHAQKTDAKMMMAGLMLAEGAQILAKPELEIFADDVVCGHGSTCGDLDAEQLFYLMSRGIDAANARAMLVRAFVEELFDFLGEGDLHTLMSGVARDWVADL